MVGWIDVDQIGENFLGGMLWKYCYDMCWMKRIED
jgi:hypothetical protein